MLPSLPEVKDYFAIAAALIAAYVAIFNWRATRFRGKLKDDLEIVKRYREELQAVGRASSEIESDEHYKILITKIQRKMIKAYVLRGTDWSDAAVSLLFFSLAFYAWNNPNFFAPGLQSAAVTTSVVAGVIYLVRAVWDRNKPHH